MSIISLCNIVNYSFASYKNRPVQRQLYKTKRDQDEQADTVVRELHHVHRRSEEYFYMYFRADKQQPPDDKAGILRCLL